MLDEENSVSAGKTLDELGHLLGSLGSQTLGGFVQKHKCWRPPERDSHLKEALLSMGKRLCTLSQLFLEPHLRNNILRFVSDFPKFGDTLD